MRTILAMLASLVCTVAAAASSADEPVGSFQGEWRTTIGIVKLEQKGSEVTGTYGHARPVSPERNCQRQCVDV